jgi:hypothetical protein
MSIAVQVKKNWLLEGINVYKNYIEEMQYKIVKIFGTPYILNVNYQNIKSIEVNIQEREIDVILPVKYRRANQNEILNALVEKIYEQIAQKEIEQIMEKTRIMLKIAPENYSISKIKNVMAKCEKQSEIIINPEIVKYKKEVIEYIIAHQFCHLKYKTHSKRFSEMLNKNFKNYKEIQNYIEKNGIKI